MTDTIFTPGPATGAAFRTALGRFATGITVVTTHGPDGPVGITANSFASVSLDPPLVLWSPARRSSRFAVFAAATHYAIHVLAADQDDLCRRFTRPGADFDIPGISFGAHQVPLLPGCLARFECERAAVHDGGDHVVILGHVLRAAEREGEPLIFASGRYGRFDPAP